MSLFKSLFESKQRVPFDLSSLQVDMHSHLIPGIDDGSQTMDETLGMLIRFADLGYKKLITTPHIMRDHYDNTPDIIKNGLHKVRQEIEKHAIPITIEAAAEYYFDEFFMEMVENNEKLLTFTGNRVLFEFSFISEPIAIDRLISSMKSKGYQPVLAHYERYMYLHENAAPSGGQGVQAAQKWRENGVEIQMNLNSLTGHYGKAIKKQAERLVDHQLVDFVGTDCHRIEHLDMIADNLTLKYFNKLKNLPLKNKLLID